jgi:glycosyltransferase involved in cell wall biosynthesis
VIPVEASCVIPAYESPDLVARALVSALTQAEIALEVVVSDDSRSPSVREWVAALAPAFPLLRYLEGPRSGNAVGNWNHGLAAARGDALVLLHQDEFFLDPLYLRRAVDALATSGAPAVVGQAAVVGIERPSRFALAGRLARALGQPLWLLPSLNWIGPTAAFVFRRGPFFDPTLVQLVDIEFYRRVAGRGPLPMLPGLSVGSLGHHRASITAAIDPNRLAGEELARLARAAPTAAARRELALHRLVRALLRRG